VKDIKYLFVNMLIFTIVNYGPRGSVFDPSSPDLRRRIKGMFGVEIGIDTSAEKKEVGRMSYSKLMLASCVLMSTSLLPLLAALAQCDKKDVPADFKISARFSPGLSRWKAWKTTITAGGDVTQDVLKDFKPEWETKKLRPLDRSALIDLMNKIRESDFDKLNKRYDDGVIDSEALILVVTLEGKTKEVVIHGPSDIEDKNAVKRFLTVWNEVLKKAPSPNKEQVPEM
jgi:hypothetical protein